MELKAYTLYDRISGLYSEPFFVQNDEVAKRRFNYFCQNTPMVASDCELYFLGEWDNTTGTLFGVKPVFLAKFEVNYGNE